MLILSVIAGPDKGRRFELPSNEPQLIGRSSEALQLGDNTISRRHAELTPDDGAWYIRDLSSQNGTYVNGVRIAERTKLRLGDQIRCGSTLFSYGHSGADEDELDLVRVLRPDQIDASIERALASNDDSVILAEPEPRAAALHHLQVIYQLTALTAHAATRDELLAGVMELVFNEFRPERGFIILCEAETSDAPSAGAATGASAAASGATGGGGLGPGFRVAVVKHRTPPKDKRDARIHVSRTILQHALRSAEGVLSTNAMSDPRFAKGDSVQQFKIRSALCSPLEFRGRKLGAIYIDSSIANYTYTPEQLALLNAIGRHAALALSTVEAYTKRLQTERLAAMGETVASLSHSIKNILQGLRGGADVVEMGLKKEDLKVSRGGWTILKRNIDRILALTLNMLAYSRQRTLELSLTPIAPLLEDCVQLMADQCAARQVAMLLDVDPEIPPINIDPSLVHQALVNLLANAVEAVEPRTGAVTVKAVYEPAGSGAAGTTGSGGPVIPAGLRSQPRVRIDVIDNGPGVPAERQQLIFEPFHTTKGLRGTGLGLAVTRRIVEEHGGTIALSSSQGQGATFSLVLPADTSSKPEDPSATAAARPLTAEDFGV